MFCTQELHNTLIMRTVRKHSINNTLRHSFSRNFILSRGLHLLFFVVVLIFFSVKCLNNIIIPEKYLYFSFMRFLLISAPALTWSSPVLPCQPSCDTSGTAYMGTTPPYLSQRDNLSSAAHGQILHGHPGLISPPLFPADNLSKAASSGRCFLWLPVLDSIIPYHSQLLCWGRY